MQSGRSSSAPIGILPQWARTTSRPTGRCPRCSISGRYRWRNSSTYSWPILLIGMLGVVGRPLRIRGRSVNRALAAVIALGIAASFTWAIVDTATSPTWAYFSTFTRGWELAAGALLALSAARLARIPPKYAAAPVNDRSGNHCLESVPDHDIVTRSQGHGPLLPVAGALLVIAAGIGGLPAFTLGLNNPVSGYVGKISYSLYLWHFPVIILLAACCRGIRPRTTRWPLPSWSSYRSHRSILSKIRCDARPGSKNLSTEAPAPPATGDDPRVCRYRGARPCRHRVDGAGAAAHACRGAGGLCRCSCSQWCDVRRAGCLRRAGPAHRPDQCRPGRHGMARPEADDRRSCHYRVRRYRRQGLRTGGPARARLQLHQRRPGKAGHGRRRFDRHGVAPGHDGRPSNPLGLSSSR